MFFPRNPVNKYQSHKYKDLKKIERIILEGEQFRTTVLVKKREPPTSPLQAGDSEKEENIPLPHFKGGNRVFLGGTEISVGGETSHTFGDWYTFKISRQENALTFSIDWNGEKEKAFTDLGNEVERIDTILKRLGNLKKNQKEKPDAIEKAIGSDKSFVAGLLGCDPNGPLPEFSGIQTPLKKHCDAYKDEKDKRTQAFQRLEGEAVIKIGCQKKGCISDEIHFRIVEPKRSTP